MPSGSPEPEVILREILLIAVAGALGTASRYGLSGWGYRLLGEHLPYGTLIVNVLGSLLLGFVMQVGLTSEAIPRSVRIAVAVGFLGAFTTFSTFGYETFRYLEDGAWWPAAANVALNLTLGLGAIWLGVVTARGLFGGA